MQTGLLRKTGLLAGVLLGTMTMVAPVRAGPPGKHLSITEVFVNFDSCPSSLFDPGSDVGVTASQI